MQTALLRSPTPVYTLHSTKNATPTHPISQHRLANSPPITLPTPTSGPAAQGHCRPKGTHCTPLHSTHTTSAAAPAQSLLLRKYQNPNCPPTAILAHTTDSDPFPTRLKCTNPSDDLSRSVFPTSCALTPEQGWPTATMQVDLSYDRNAGVMNEPLLGVSKGEPYKIRGYFAKIFSLWQVILLVLFGLFTVYSDEASKAPTKEIKPEVLLLKYPALLNVHIMVFVGFGFLMTFLRRDMYSAVGFTFLAACFTIEWYILCKGFWVAVFDGERFWNKPAKLNIDSLIFGDFSAAVFLITYGVLLGKVSPGQILFISILETVFYSLNETIAEKSLRVMDIGGTTLIHMFGAFYGLALALFFQPRRPISNVDNKSSYLANTFAMVGTIFLWIFWPSFNAVLAGDLAIFLRVVLNTVLSLCGSCIGAFLFSYHWRGQSRFDMADVQNATLAGGVVMGTVASLLTFDGAAAVATALGCLSGVVSVFGFVTVQPWLEKKLGLYDTCGVLNLHGMPSLLGAVAGVVATIWVTDGLGPEQLALEYEEVAIDQRSSGYQAKMQLAFMFVTLGIALVSGALTGVLVKLCAFLDPAPPACQFNDEAYWIVPDEEIPHYFQPQSTGEEGPHSHAQRLAVLEDHVRTLQSSLSRVKQRI
eukprot:g13492.t1